MNFRPSMQNNLKADQSPSFQFNVIITIFCAVGEILYFVPLDVIAINLAPMHQNTAGTAMPVPRNVAIQGFGFSNEI